jgi:acetate kinase
MKNILVLNAGSSSLKFAVFDGGSLAEVLHGQAGGLGSHPRFSVRQADGKAYDTGFPGLDRDAGHAKAPATMPL